MNILERIDEHIEFHKSIDSHKSDVAFLRAVRDYVTGLEAENEKLLARIGELELKLADAILDQ